MIHPESIRELDAEHYRLVRELLRAWCGETAVAPFDELEELRKEIKRVVDVAEKAIGVLRQGFRQGGRAAVP